MDKHTDVKQLVQEHYGEVARRASGGGPAATCCTPTEIYTPLKILGLPDTVLAASAGCGDPTALAELKSGEVVLDLGSGGGVDCFLAGRAVGPEGLVLGVDMTQDMVKLASSNSRKLRASNVSFTLAHLESLPMATSTVDVIISNCVINLSSDKDRVFQEAFRVLKPGGRMHVSDVMLTVELPESVRADAEALVGCIAGADLKDVYLDRMYQAGFEGITVKEEGSLGAEGKVPAGVVSSKIVAVKPFA